MAALHLNAPANGEEIVLLINDTITEFTIDFPIDAVIFEKIDDTLNIYFEEENAVISLDDFYAIYHEDFMPDFIIDGSLIAGVDFFAAFDPELMPSMGYVQIYSQRNNLTDQTQTLADGTDSLDGLLGKSAYSAEGLLSDTEGSSSEGDGQSDNDVAKTPASNGGSSTSAGNNLDLLNPSDTNEPPLSETVIPSRPTPPTPSTTPDISTVPTAPKPTQPEQPEQPEQPTQPEQPDEELEENTQDDVSSKKPEIQVEITTDNNADTETPSTDGVINKNELDQDGGIKANVTLGPDSQAGDKITVTLTDSNNNKYQKEFNYEDITFNEDGSFDVTFETPESGFPDGEVKVEASITDSDGNSANDNDSANLGTSLELENATVSSDDDAIGLSHEVALDLEDGIHFDFDDIFQVTDNTGEIIGNFTVDESGNLIFTQTAPYMHQSDSDSATLNVELPIVGENGNTGFVQVAVTVHDSQPNSTDDTNSVNEGQTITVNTANGLLSNDTASADGGNTITNIQGSTSEGWSEAVQGHDGSFTITHENYGTLTVNPDGSYSFISKPNSVDESTPNFVFEYTVTDSDGDSSTSTLTIDPTAATSPMGSPEDYNVQVHESDLATGTIPQGDSETTVWSPNEGYTLVNFVQNSYDSDIFDVTTNETGELVITLKENVKHNDPNDDDETTLHASENIDTTITVTVQDEYGNNFDMDVNINIVDDAPVVSTATEHNHPAEDDDPNTTTATSTDGIASALITIDHGADMHNGKEGNLSVGAKIELPPSDGATTGLGVEWNGETWVQTIGSSWLSGVEVSGDASTGFTIVLGDVTFTQQTDSMGNPTNNWEVSYSVSDRADVEIIITDSDGDEVRHTVEASAPQFAYLDNGDNSLTTYDAAVEGVVASDEQPPHATSTASGTFIVESEAGIASFTLGQGDNLVTFTLDENNELIATDATGSEIIGDITVKGEFGELSNVVITHNNGLYSVSYDYTQTDVVTSSELHDTNTSADADNSDYNSDSTLGDSFDITITDTNGDSITQTGGIQVNIVDDVVSIVEVNEGSVNDLYSVSGILEANSADGVDSIVPSFVYIDGTEYSVHQEDANYSVQLPGGEAIGSITLTANPDGTTSWTFTANSLEHTGDISISFTATDNDGDSATITTNAIQMNQKPELSFGNPHDLSDNLTTYDDIDDTRDSDNDNDSSAHTTNGSFTITLGDGTTTISINEQNIEIDANGFPITDLETFTVNGEYGTLANFTYDPASGEVTYTYTQNGATQAHNTDEGKNSSEESVQDRFTINVSDSDTFTDKNDSSTGEIIVTIKDDAVTVTSGNREDSDGNPNSTEMNAVNGFAEGEITVNFGADMEGAKIIAKATATYDVGVKWVDGEWVKMDGYAALGDPVIDYTYTDGVHTITLGDVTLTSTDNQNWSVSYEADAVDKKLIFEDGDGDTVEHTFYMDNSAAERSTKTGFTSSDGDNSDIIYGTDSDDALYGDEGNNTIYGENGNDFLFGGEGNDILYGGEDEIFNDVSGDMLLGEKNTLDGGAGDDILVGGIREDILLGGTGSDTLEGGEGEDTFIWKLEDFAHGDVDVAVDFNVEEDTLDLSELKAEGYVFEVVENTEINGFDILVSEGSEEGAATQTISLNDVGETISADELNVALNSSGTFGFGA